MARKKKLIDNDVKLDKKTLELYNNLSTVCGIFSIVLVPTGLFGIIIGFLGICLSVTYYTNLKRIKMGYILSIIGSILSAIFLAITLCMSYGVIPK